MLGVSEPTFFAFLKRHEEAQEAYELGDERGKASLRHIQWKIAEGGNASMAIFLGKNRLDQADKTEHLGKDGGPLIVELVKFTDAADKAPE